MGSITDQHHFNDIINNPESEKVSPDITMPLNHMEAIFTSQTINKEDLKQILRADDPAIIAYKQEEPPKAKVSLFRLLVPEKQTIPLSLEENIQESFPLKEIKTSYLWDLSPFKKVDILRFGRFKTNDFHPILSETPLTLDLKVSREHSLIGLYNEKVYYIDLGTSQKYKKHITKEEGPSHIGSKNGSWFYHDNQIQECIKNTCIEWNIKNIIGLGSFFYNITWQGNEIKLAHQFFLKFKTLNV